MRATGPRVAESVRSEFRSHDSSVRPNHTERFQPDVSGDRWRPLRPGEPRLDDAISKAGSEQPARRPLPGGGQCASGTRGSDGGDLGQVGGRDRDGRPRFDQPVQAGAYLWWYVDAISDDGKHALSIIAFAGSVFSPYYAWALARRGDQVDALNHCAINVALYGKSGKRWAMTERGSASIHRTADYFNVGPSTVSWQHDHLRIDVNELCAPLPYRVRGTVRLYPSALSSFVTALDAGGRHRWGPIAPCARVEVDLAQPSARWSGEGYFDSNDGDEPIDRPFEAWDWSRARMKDGSTAVLYDVRQTNGTERLIAQRFTEAGESEPFAPPAQVMVLPKTLWRIQRSTHADPGTRTLVMQTLEDAPFYARSLLRTQLLGESVTAVHETLQPQRLNMLPVRLMLPWRMPRRA